MDDLQISLILDELQLLIARLFTQPLKILATPVERAVSLGDTRQSLVMSSDFAEQNIAARPPIHFPFRLSCVNSPLISINH